MFKTIINNAGNNLFSPEKAEALAADLNADVEDGFVYTVTHCPKGTGFSFITITDEDGNIVGKL